METPDFDALARGLHADLVRVAAWQRVLRLLATVVYLFVFCWLVFVLLGGMLAARIGWESYSRLTTYIFPAFAGFALLSYLLSQAMLGFSRREHEAMRKVMARLFPSVRFSFDSEVDAPLLTESRLFTSSHANPALAVEAYGEVEAGEGDNALHVADVGVSYGWTNRLQYYPGLNYVVMVYRLVVRPLFARRIESSAHNFRGMFGWCRTARRYEGTILLLPDHLEDKLGYLAQNIQALRRRYDTRLVRLEDPDFERHFVVYADDEVAARMLLTPALMRRLVQLRTTFGCDLLLSFRKGRFYYAASMPQGFLGLRAGGLKDGQLLREIYYDLSMACRLADELLPKLQSPGR